MFTTERPQEIASCPSESPSSVQSLTDLLKLDEFEDEDYQDCTEMETLYFSFEAQAQPFANDEEFCKITEQPGPSCEAFGQRQSEGETSDPDTIEQTSPVEETDDQPESSCITPRPSGEKRWLAFTRRRAASFQDESMELIGKAEERSHPMSSDMTSLHSCLLSDLFAKDDKSHGAAEGVNPDMLVTLTTMEMGISAKREDSLDHPMIPFKPQSQFAEDYWNVDSIHDSSIFDKAQLVEEALDTAEIKKCMDGRSESHVSMNVLPSLSVHEQYSDELRSITKNYDSSSSSGLDVFPVLPSYRMESLQSEPELIRAHSAPSEVKGVGVLEEDDEIYSIMGNSVYFNPYHSSESRALSSFSEPVEEVISERDSKKCLTTWVQKKIHFVSFDTESDAASVTRSEYIMNMKRAKERRDTEERRYHHRSHPSSHSGYVNGFMLGPSISPVPRGGIQDFSRDDAIALNAALRNDPQLTNVPMGEWTSKLIGFATPADYYVHMIHELSVQRINVLALIKARLGEHHPLVTEIIEKLKDYTTEAPSFILGGTTKGHRRTPPLTPNQKLSLFSGGSDDYHQSVEAALINWGVNVAFFDKTRSSFASEHDYYKYIARQIKTAGFDITVEKLKENLGETHPFIEIFKSSANAATEPESCSRTGSLTDSARSIQSGTPKSSARVTLPPSQKSICLSDSPTHSRPQVEIVRDECEAETGVSSSFCFFFCFGGYRKSLSRKITKRESSYTAPLV